VSWDSFSASSLSGKYDNSFFMTTGIKCFSREIALLLNAIDFLSCVKCPYAILILNISMIFVNAGTSFYTAVK